MPDGKRYHIQQKHYGKDISTKAVTIVEERDDGSVLVREEGDFAQTFLVSKDDLDPA